MNHIESHYADNEYRLRLTEHDRIGQEEWDTKIRQEQQEQRRREEELRDMLVSPVARRGREGRPRELSPADARPGGRYLALLRECGPYLLLLACAPWITKDIPFGTYEGHVLFRISYWAVLGVSLLPLALFFVWLRRLERRGWLRLAAICFPLETYFMLYWCQRVPWLVVVLLICAGCLAALLWAAPERRRLPPPAAMAGERPDPAKRHTSIRRPHDTHGNHRLFRAAVIGYACFMLVPAALGALSGPLGAQAEQTYQAKASTDLEDGLRVRLHDALRLLSPGIWEDLSTEQKRQAFQTVLDVEALYLPMPGLAFKDLQDIRDYNGYTLRRALRSYPDEVNARLRVVCCAAYYKEMEAKHSGMDKKLKEAGAREYVGGRVAWYKELMNDTDAQEGLQTQE